VFSSESGCVGFGPATRGAGAADQRAIRAWDSTPRAARLRPDTQWTARQGLDSGINVCHKWEKRTRVGLGARFRPTREKGIAEPSRRVAEGPPSLRPMGPYYPPGTRLCREPGGSGRIGPGAKSIFGCSQTGSWGARFYPTRNPGPGESPGGPTVAWLIGATQGKLGSLG